MEPAAASLSEKRICYAITKDSWGGAQAYVYGLSLAARSEGAEVSVLIGSATPTHTTTTLSSRLREAGIPVILLSHIQRDIGLVRELRAAIELYRTLSRLSPEVLHLNSSKMGLLGSLAGRLAGVPHIVFTAHGWPHREPRSTLWKLVIKTASWATILFSHTVIVVSDCDLDTAPVLLGRRKLVRIYNGVEQFSLESRLEARAHYIKHSPNLSHFPTWLLMHAELHVNKGVDIAITALSEIADSFPHVALVIAGAGEQEEYLKDLARRLHVEDRVCFLGFIPSARTYLCAGDLFLMPSRKEGFPLALLEAALARRPVIVSDVGGMPEVITDGVHGLVIPSGDPGELAHALSTLLTNPEHAQSFGHALFERVTRIFSYARMLRETLAQYR